ncbi:putative molybdenum carrier protein [Candidatus Sulfidibacterium hydrothermale]|uniref:putative molybdenum carrier protein n=1 Tax=Candidatus Sulfidibacterium hydrothermale TaxID=2875962 RepID=UPI001F0A500B|nr:putative molybdenum carrier protein [Candidatus Sulfidibacterium hydrothermale]UBM61426.1 putative molybdenum carrier protein [Candidatus Sulfidibacterium hydrothermale]
MTDLIKSRRIISGGQTGVDRAALDFAIEHGITCSGWCPKGRRAEDGTIPEHYPLKETESRYYSERTKRNVQESDGLLVFLLDKPDTGTFEAIDYAEKYDKPVYVVHLTMNIEDQQTGLLNMLEENHIEAVNIVGPRESNSPGIYQKTKDFLDHLLFRLKNPISYSR